MLACGMRSEVDTDDCGITWVGAFKCKECGCGAFDNGDFGAGAVELGASEPGPLVCWGCERLCHQRNKDARNAHMTTVIQTAITTTAVVEMAVFEEPDTDVADEEAEEEAVVFAKVASDVSLAVGVPVMPVVNLSVDW